MGMALKTDPLQLKITSIWKTANCPLARLVRLGLKKRGFSGDFTVVYSGEQPKRAVIQDAEKYKPEQKSPNGSIVTVTASAGLLLANLVLRGVLKDL
jgi:tRNA A37 threonylcarbamoyladenosine dehydratase